MRLAIMQPYFFPYIGYFQLIKAVDKLIFYDDVNFIKRGWINRNRIIINNSAKHFTVQLLDASQNKLINEVKFIDNRPKLLKTIKMAYKKAPFYKKCMPLIQEIMNYETQNISDLAVYSVKKVCEYLDLKTQFETSSEKYTATRGFEKSKRLKEICKLNKASNYVNPIGGQKIYNKEDFQKEGIKLQFIKPNITEYKQFNNEFIPGLSILDIMMFNSVADIHNMLDNYELI
ncbi:MAG: WbqC family protein [Candidatus Woesearchaeota archaeon]